MPLTHLENQLRERARALIEQGLLPASSPTKTFGGYGMGESCSLCGKPVPPPEVEYEVVYNRGIYRFHFMCHAAWQFEQARREHLDNLAASGNTGATRE
ncbi:MAG TPA: hypothetical protein VFO44_11915 [Steroidobacteraceae bacterium]|nr:hypothetical protein [Steroidobacteraceae bacterium]